MLILILVIVVILVKISDNKQKITGISKFNEQFESIYKNRKIYGADVLTIINKAIDNNNIYDIEKDNDGNYKEDGNYCLNVELTLLGADENGQVYEVQYPMEVLFKARIR